MTAPGDIDANQRGSIIVHKHKQQTPPGAPGTGQPETPAGDAIAGVEFKIQKLDLDLTQNTDWETLKTLTPDAAKNRLVGFEATRTTDNNGEATFDNLDIGAYLVTETNAPDNVVKKAAPFIVTVPHPNGNTWNYNVHVYPKNTVSAKPTKTLDDTGATKIGDSVTWTITQVLPELPQGERFTEVSFTDQLAEKLDYVNTTAQVDDREVGVTVTATGNGNRNLEGSLDDTATLTGGETVTFKITTTVNTPGKIVNTAKVTIKTSTGGDTTQSTPDPGQGPGGGPGGAPTLIYGYFDIQKYVKDTMIAISDATFEFYKSTDCTGNKVDFGETLVTVDTGRLVGAIAVKAGKYSIKEVTVPFLLVSCTLLLLFLVETFWFDCPGCGLFQSTLFFVCMGLCCFSGFGVCWLCVVGFLHGVVSLLLQARGVVSNILTLALVFSALVSAQTGQTVAGVGVATGQNTMLQQVAGGEPVKPTTTTTSLQPNNTGANNTSKTKPATNTKPPHISQLPAGVNRTAFIPDLVKTTTTTNKTEYYPGEAASIQVSFSYNDAAYQEVQDIQSNQDSYTVKINFNVQLPTGFTISPETLTRGPFTRDCTDQRACMADGFEYSYNQQSRRLTGSFPTPTRHYKDGGEYQLFEELNITGTVTGTPNTSHTVTTTANGVLDFSY
ncbi:isopeptide-forming domain-containing fimbrial protein, partial [Canibacter sp. lx-72]|uniref:SpaH/EbpB family LPXTG-anchored major pilin n=1 Tax=Canibacter zhuwentaonis TaxID=2837491 RepID=UPI001BDD527A|nr:isopeptide-forming domain-containing fimbrial protein [Canibacter zhuwentaonis]